MDTELSKKRAEITNEEIARIFLTEVSHDVAIVMEMKLEERYGRINQLTRLRYASLYCNDLKTHISRIEATLKLENNGLSRDGEPTCNIGRSRPLTQMGCFNNLPDKRNGVKQRRMIRMGRLEIVLLETYTTFMHLEHVSNKRLIITILINLIT